MKETYFSLISCYIKFFYVLYVPLILDTMVFDCFYITQIENVFFDLVLMQNMFI